MKQYHRIAVLTLGLLCSALVFAGSAADNITVSDPYARAVPPGQPNSAAFMGITNSSDQDLALVAAESTVSKVVELHTHVMNDGMMQMRKIDKIDLPAGKMVMLKPGGLHVMLIGLTQELKPDSNIAVTLVFNDGSKKQLDLPVRKIEMSMQKHNGMEHKH